MGGKGKAQITRNSIQFLDRLGEQFDWDNTEVKELQVVRSEPDKVQRDHIVPVEITGIKIKNNYEAVPDPAIKLEVKKRVYGCQEDDACSACECWF